MRNLELIDAVIALHDIARLVETEIGIGKLSQDIRKCADSLHQHSIAEREVAVKAQNVIEKAKE